MNLGLYCMDLSTLYAEHHAEMNRFGFSIAEVQRSGWFLDRLKKQNRSISRLLDVGCRDGTLTRHFAQTVDQIVGIDIDPTAIAAAKARISSGEFFTLDISGDWSVFPAESFDAVLCSEVLEHVYYPGRVCEQIKRVLAPGGIFIGSVPNAFFLKHRLRYLVGKRRYTPLEDPTHITQFNEEILREILEVVGHEILIEGYTRPPLSGLAKKIPNLCAFDFLFQVKKEV